ncbi:uncharacterized protein LOC115216700 [Argonauta hians]
MLGPSRKGLLQDLKKNSHIHQEKFKRIFERYDQSFSECDAVDINAIFSNSGGSDKSQKKASKSKNKVNGGKPLKVLIPTHKYSTRSATKGKRTKTLDNIVKGLGAGLKSAKKSNETKKDVNKTNTKKRCDRSVFCDPPTLMVVDEEGEEEVDRNDIEENKNVNNGLREGLKPQKKSNKAKNKTNKRKKRDRDKSMFCDPPTLMVVEEEDGNDIENKNANKGLKLGLKSAKKSNEAKKDTNKKNTKKNKKCDSYRSVLCDPPTLMVLNEEEDDIDIDDEYDENVNFNDDDSLKTNSFASQLEVSPFIHENIRNLSPSPILEEANGKLSKKRNLKIWNEHFKNFFVSTGQYEKLNLRKPSKVLPEWERSFAHLFPK